jgi:Protein of unknown function (DUF2490)
MALLLLCVAGAVAPSSARADETTTEFWPEAAIYFRLNPRTTLMLNTAPNRSFDSGDKTNDTYGLYLNYKPIYRISYRIGYVHSVNLPMAPGETKVVEHRIVLDYSYGWPIGRAGLLWDRTRIDLRDRDGEFSQRFRNRVRYQHDTQIARLPAIAFVDAELYYDTRFGALSRYKFQIGVVLLIAPTVTLTPYFGRQIDTQPETKITNGLGLILGLHF